MSIDACSRKQLEDEKLERMITHGTMHTDPIHERDDNFSQRGSKIKNGATIIKEGRMPVSKDPKDDIYIIDENIKTIGPHSCSFCNRLIEPSLLTGPFIKDTSKE